MEDAHTNLLTLPDDKNAAFFAVYDGHGGAEVSQYASLHLHKKIVENPLYGTIIFFLINYFFLEEGKIEEAIKKGFLDFDKQFSISQEKKKEICGTTAITVLIKDNFIYCGLIFYLYILFYK